MARKSTYTEKSKTSIQANLEKANPGYTFSRISGPIDTIDLQSTGFTFGNAWIIKKFVIDFDFFFEASTPIEATYSYTGPTSGRNTARYEPSIAGFDLLFGYQLLENIKPYLGFRSEGFTQTAAVVTSTGSVGLITVNYGVRFALAGLSFQYEIDKNLYLATQIDYGTAISYSNATDIESGRIFNAQIGLRWTTK